MFCKYCGAPSETEVCPNCAATRAQAETQQPAQAQQPAAAGNFAETLKKNLHYIVAGVAALALIIGLLAMFGVMDVNATVKMMGQKQSGSDSVSNAVKALKTMGGSGAMLYVANILFGLTSLAAAAIGALYFLKVFKGMPHYDKFIAAKLKFGGPAFLMGAVGTIGAVLQFLFYMFCSVSKKIYGSYKMEMSLGVNWTTWLMLVLFVGLIVLDKCVLNKKEK